jgi:hypothetical protein
MPKRCFIHCGLHTFSVRIRPAEVEGQKGWGQACGRGVSLMDGSSGVSGTKSVSGRLVVCLPFLRPAVTTPPPRAVSVFTRHSEENGSGGSDFGTLGAFIQYYCPALFSSGRRHCTTPAVPGLPRHVTPSERRNNTTVMTLRHEGHRALDAY